MAITIWSDTNISQLSKPTLVVTSKLIYPTNDALYGPYTSVEDAFNSVALYLGSKKVRPESTDAEKIAAGQKLIPQGLTVGVSENSGMNEYWFKRTKGKTEPYTLDDLVVKSSGSGSGSGNIRFEKYSDKEYYEYN